MRNKSIGNYAKCASRINFSYAICAFFSVDIYANRVYSVDVRKLRNLDEEVTELKYPNIEAERARKGMSQDVLAERLGVTRKTVFNWMTNGNIPTGKLIEMADLFGCSIDYLLGRG